MGWYRRVKLTLDGFHSLASRIVLQNQNFRQGSWIIQSGCCDSCSKDSNLNAISSFYSISYRLATRSGGFKRNLHNPFVGGGRRYYYVDPQNVQHFKPRGPRGWCQNPSQVFIVVVVGSGILITVHFRTLDMRMELEADYIGILLLASAGFDPRVAPQVYEKLERINGESPGLMDYLSTHPSGKKESRVAGSSQDHG